MTLLDNSWVIQINFREGSCPSDPWQGYYITHLSDDRWYLIEARPTERGDAWDYICLILASSNVDAGLVRRLNVGVMNYGDTVERVPPEELPLYVGGAYISMRFKALFTC